MPSQIVVVHDALDFVEDVALLRGRNLDALGYTDSMAALDALENAERIELLVTCTEFQPGKPNGLALARMAQLRRSEIRVLLTGPEELAPHAAGIGEFLSAPVSAEDLVVSIEQMLGVSPREE